jgi:5-methylcytosine-specific restriction endonuclease McrA
VAAGLFAIERRWRATDQRFERAIAGLRRLPYSSYLKTNHWACIRAFALERAHHQCALCPTTSPLDVHHRSYQRLGFEAPEDLIVLCRECHDRHHQRLRLAGVRATNHEPIAAPMVSAAEIRWLKNA